MVAAGMAAIICVLMILFPAEALDSARKGVNIWLDTVLPALLPFFICANFMAAMGVPRLIGRAFDGLFQKIFNVSGISAFVFFISTSSGYPMGAMLIGKLARKGEIKREEAKVMLAFCTTSGPLFMLGAVGVGMLGSPKAGYIIAFSHYLGAMLNGLLWSKLKPIRSYSHIRNQNKAIPKVGSRERLSKVFTRSILSSLETVGIICCYLILFTMISDFLMLSGIFQWSEKDIWGIGASGILEMTVGCHGVSLSKMVSVPLKIALSTFFISFGGLSIMAQSMSLLSGTGIGPFYYLRVKITHGLIGAAISLALGTLLMPYAGAEAVSTFSDGKLLTGTFSGYLSLWIFSLKGIVLLILAFAFTVIAGEICRCYNSGKGKKD
ncbi:MAG: hypothetical protein ACOX4U_07680 [Anaerovoracaceae bacterium]